MAQDYRTLKLEVLAETKQFVKGMNDANKETVGFGDKLGAFAKKAGVALAAVGAAAGAMAIKVGKEAVAAASDLAESTSKVGVIFEGASEEITKFASTAAASLGQTRIQAQNAAATFATFGKAAGLVGTDLSDFSIEFVKLASDLASFNNTSVDQAINALGAALRGESEPMRAYGVLLNDATLKAQAMEMGLYNGKGALDQQAKVLAAHQVILNQTKDAQGDFARTADGMANSQRILTARLEEAKVTLGQALLPVVLTTVSFLTDKFLPIIENITKAFSNPEGAGLIENVKTFISQAKEFLAPILEAVTDAFAKVSKSISDNKDNFEAVLSAIEAVYKFFVTYFVPYLKGSVVNAITGIGTVFGTVFKVISPIIGAIAKLIEGIVGIVQNAIKSIIGLVNTAIDAINKVLAAYNKIPILKDVSLIPNVKVPGAASGSNTINANQMPFGTPTGDALSALEKELGGPEEYSKLLGEALAAGADTSPEGLRKFAKDKGKDEKQIQNIDEWINDQIETNQQIQNAMEQTNKRLVEVMTARAAGLMMDENNRIVINVNSPSIIDENGFSRAIVDALNGDYRRTGGGVGALDE